MVENILKLFVNDFIIVKFKIVLLIKNCIVINFFINVC